MITIELYRMNGIEPIAESWNCIYCHVIKEEGKNEMEKNYYSFSCSSQVESISIAIFLFSDFFRPLHALFSILNFIDNLVLNTKLKSFWAFCSSFILSISPISRQMLRTHHTTLLVLLLLCHTVFRFCLAPCHWCRFHLLIWTIGFLF